MAFPFAALAFGGLSAVSGLLSTAGAQQQSFAQTRARNRSLLSSYNYQQDAYRRDVLNRYAVYEQRKKQYQKQVQYNNQELLFAAQEEQMRLNDLFDSAMVDNQNSLINFYKVDGSARATGQSGKSIDRIEQSNRAALGRLYATRSAGLRRGIDRKKFNDQRNRLRIQNLNEQAYAQVAIAPTAGPAPVFSGYEQYQGGWNTRYAGNILSGIQTGLQYAPNLFVKPPN